MSANSTLTAGSLMYPAAAILSAMACASSLRVLPWASIVPMMGMPSIPWSSTVRIWSELGPDAAVVCVPESELYELQELNGTASSGLRLLTTIVRRSSGLMRICPFWSICSNVSNCAFWMYQAFFHVFFSAEHDTKNTTASRTVARKIDFICLNMRLLAQR